MSAAFTRNFLMTVEKVLVNTADISHLKLCRTDLWWKSDKYSLVQERVLSW